MLKPVHALVGTDLFLQLDALAELLKEAPSDIQRIDFDGETAELSEALDELRSFAMFSSSKLVVIRNADPFITKFRESLEQYIGKPAGGSTLILRVNSLPANQRVYKLIKAQGQVHECAPPKEKDLPAWVIRRAKSAHALAVGAEAARVLVDHVGDDLGRLDNELAKLALQSTGGQVDASVIERTVAFQREQEMWNLTDDVAAGNITSALTRWRRLTQLDASTEFRAVTWLTIWLEKARKALAMRREGTPDAMIAKELRIWPFEQQRAFFQTATALGDAGVSRLINLLAEVDHRSKSGLGEMSDNVERFILSVKR